MPEDNLVESKHFSLEPLSKGVYACIHKFGGAAYSNAGIIDLGDRTILVDAFDTQAAGRDLRQTAESLFERLVDTIILTHGHSDHWIGASVFDVSTLMLSSKVTRQVCLDWGAEIMEEFKNPAEWEEWIKELEEQILTEQDERVRVGLEKSIIRTRYTLAEMAEFKPRYPDHTFEDTITLEGSQRKVELLSLGPGHSEDDAVLLLPQEEISFIGDIGFFDAQPFLGYCDIDLYRKQLNFFQNSYYQILVPGHGRVGNKDDIELQLRYLDLMEDLVSSVVERDGSFEEALQITLPEPFDRWLTGGMERFKVNVGALFKHFGGEVPDEK